jgi:glycosyltransferase involved in cell wall biosynthesis
MRMRWMGSKLVIGDGPECAKLKAAFPEVQFVGFLFDDALAQSLAAADVLVFPSRSDTFGLVMLEAMACGVPIAAYPVTGSIDVVDDGITGALDEDLRSAAIRALSIDPRACRARALRSGWDLCTREFERNLVPCAAAQADAHTFAIRQRAQRYSIPARTSGISDGQRQVLARAPWQYRNPRLQEQLISTAFRARTGFSSAIR